MGFFSAGGVVAAGAVPVAAFGGWVAMTGTSSVWVPKAGTSAAVSVWETGSGRLVFLCYT